MYSFSAASLDELHDLCLFFRLQECTKNIDVLFEFYARGDDPRKFLEHIKDTLKTDFEVANSNTNGIPSLALLKCMGYLSDEAFQVACLVKNENAFLFVDRTDEKNAPQR